MRCTFCGHHPDRHLDVGGCYHCNCERTREAVQREQSPSLKTIVQADTPCMYCNALEAEMTCAVCGAPREA
jgi:hypothetical protein